MAVQRLLRFAACEHREVVDTISGQRLLRFHGQACWHCMGMR